MKTVTTFTKGGLLKGLLLPIMLLFGFTILNAQNLVPYTGSSTVTACSGTVLDHAGTGSYSNSANGTLVINPTSLGASVTLSGSYDTESGWDFITVFAGAGTGGTILVGPVSGTGTINITGGVGQSLTVRFTSDGSITSTGFSLNVSCSGGGPVSNLVPFSGNNTITACSGSVQDHGGTGNYANSANGTLVINPSSGGVAVQLSGSYDTELNFDFVTVYAGAGTGGAILAGPVSGTGTLNVTGTIGQPITIRFTSDISVTRPGFDFAISCTAPVSPLIVPASGNATASACSGSVTDHGGAGNYANNVNGTLVLSPSTPGASVTISGAYSTETNFDYITVFSGAGTGGTVLVGPVSGTGSINVTGAPGQPITIRFTSDISITSSGFDFAVSCNTPVTSAVVPFSGSTSITTCGATVTDHGGAGNYGNNANGTLVINPTGPGNSVNLNGSYDVENSWDFIRIYAGAGTGGALLFTGTGVGSLNVTGNVGQAVTIQFTSDFTVTRSGFSLTVSCVTAPVACQDFSLTAPASTTGNTCGAGNQSNLRTSEDVIYKVTIPVSGCYTFSMCGTTPNWDSYMYLTTLCPGTGGTPGGGTILASDDDGCGGIGVSTISNLSLAAGTYYLTIEGFSSGCGAYNLNVTGGANPVAGPITGPSGAYGCGSSVSFSVPSALGVTYTWSTTSGTITSGQGTSTVTIAWGSGSGTVSVVPSNACGTGAAVSTTSACTPGPANDDCGNATVFAGNSQPFSTVFATGTDISSCTFGDFNDVWFTWTAPACGQVTFNTCGSGFDTHLSLWSSCGAGEIACNDDFCGLQSSISATVVAGQTYYLRAAGYNGAQGNGTINMSMSAPLSGSASSSDVSCFGGNNGSASVSVSGGSGSYSYSWSNGGNTATISGLTAGTYNVVVTDGFGCTYSASVTVNEPTALGGSLAAQTYVGGVNVSCNGAADGSIFANISGGTAPYSYAWSNGGTAQLISGLTAGNYSVVVTDANGCTFSASTTLTEPAPMANTISAATFACGTNVSCNGASDGSINLTVTGGSGNYAFSWSNGATTEDLSGLSAGTYNVTAVDQNGCSTSASITLTEPAVLTASLNSSIYACGYGISCNGASDGSLSSVVSGGCAPYSYAWSTGGIGGTINGLSAGMYSVTVTDANGCQAFATGELTQPAPVTVTCSGNATVYYGWGPNACATISASGIGGGCAPYSILWSNGATTASQTVCPSTSTDYTVTVTDANGCTASCVVRVCAIDVRCGNNLQKIEICHNPPGNAQTLCISPNAVLNHLSHGDYLGACGSNVPCGPNNKSAGAEPAAAVESIEMAAFPNPFQSSTTLRFTVPTDDNVTLNVFAMDGRNMGSIFEGTVNAGKTYEAEFKADAAANGIYFAKLTTANGTVTTMKLVLMK